MYVAKSYIYIIYVPIIYTKFTSNICVFSDSLTHALLFLSLLTRATLPHVPRWRRVERLVHSQSRHGSDRRRIPSEIESLFDTAFKSVINLAWKPELFLFSPFELLSSPVASRCSLLTPASYF